VAFDSQRISRVLELKHLLLKKIGQESSTSHGFLRGWFFI
jgi:hypothetical protein